VARQSADSQTAFGGCRYRIETAQAVDIDNNLGASESQIHERHQALAASENLGIVAVFMKQLERLIERCRREIFEDRGFHRR
jgi:hypothetical protein